MTPPLHSSRWLKATNGGLPSDQIVRRKITVAPRRRHGYVKEDDEEISCGGDGTREGFKMASRRFKW